MNLLRRWRRIREYKRLAKLLNDLPVDPAMQPGYDVMSDGLIWRDEAPLDHPPRERWEIRSLWRHRTCLIMGESSDHAHLWTLGLRLFPDWPGFLPDRRAPRDEYRELVAASRVEWEAWCIENEDKPPWEW